MFDDNEQAYTGSEKADRYIGREGKPFRLRSQVKNIINSVYDLERILEQPDSIKPRHFQGDINSNNFSPETPEFVDLTRVVGGADSARYNGTFLIEEKGKESEGRGRNHVLEIAKSYAEGRPLDPQKPQEFYEVDGEYYVTRGRHSVTAMKALGVKLIPALVTHVTRKNS